jgi:hypothetical protein
MQSIPNLQNAKMYITKLMYKMVYIKLYFYYNHFNNIRYYHHHDAN